jgi:hypothetical protein
MPINKVFLAAREIEQRNRLITYLPWPAPLRIATRPPRGLLGWLIRLAGLRPASRVFPIRHLTERHLMELRTVGNAFVVGGGVRPVYIALFLWRLHPLFIRPDGELPNRRTSSERAYATAGQRLAAWRARRQIARWVKELLIGDAVRVITDYIEVTQQDAPDDGDDVPKKGGRGAACPPFNTWDGLVTFCAERFHFDPLGVLDLPRSLIFQSYRHHLLQQPDGALMVCDRSDKYLDENVAAAEAHLVFAKLHKR